MDELLSPSALWDFHAEGPLQGAPIESLSVPCILYTLMVQRSVCIMNFTHSESAKAF